MKQYNLNMYNNGNQKYNNNNHNKLLFTKD